MIDRQQLNYVEAMRAREKIFGTPFATSDLDLTRRTVERIQQAFSADGPGMSRIVDAPIDGGSDVLCRFFFPNRAQQAAAGALVYLHGGGWMINSVDTHDHLYRTYADMTGLTVIAPRYRKAPEHPFPAALDDVTSVMTSIANGGSLLGLKRGALFIGGDSAGGNLALSTAIRLRDIASRPLTGVIVNYGVLDCNFDTPSYRRFGEGGYLLSRSAMEMFFSNYAAGAHFAVPAISPLRADLAGLPPIFITVGEADVLQSENIELANRAMRAQVACDLDVYSGLMHGFIRIPHLIDRARLALERQRRWIHDLAA
jgi:acetyl esterase